jgi:hypothetical protein
MEKVNIREYEFIRSEMLNLKNCITSYMGYAISGSGIVLLGLAAINRTAECWDVLNFVSMIISLLLSLVLLIIFYKFNSHNRYAGYCKLLNQERLERKTDLKNDINDLMAWEICMDRLRASDFDARLLIDMCNNIEIKGLTKDQIIDRISMYAGKNPSADKHKFTNGLKIFLDTFRGKVQTRSWQFPLFVVMVFFPLTILFVFLSTYFMLNYTLCICQSRITQIFLILFSLFFWGVQFAIWKNFLGKLHNLLEGSSTVDAYCWKFLPIRYRFIIEKHGSIEYCLTSLKD